MLSSVTEKSVRNTQKHAGLLSAKAKSRMQSNTVRRINILLPVGSYQTTTKVFKMFQGMPTVKWAIHEKNMKQPNPIITEKKLNGKTWETRKISATEHSNSKTSDIQEDNEKNGR